MAASQFFSSNYTQARRRFTDSAGEAGATIISYRHPGAGPEGESLSTDVAWLGPKDAARVLLTVSGTHGAEGFCGSGAQVGWFESGLANEMPADIALVSPGCGG